MRLFVCTIVALASIGLNTASAQFCHHGGYHSQHYYPVRTVYYYPQYYSAPMYYAPPVYSAPPMQYQMSVTQPNDRSTDTPMRPTTMVDIALKDNAFEPVTLTVAAGTTVRWTNSGQHKHTVTSDTGKWDSGDLDTGNVYSATFVTPGTYQYYCRHHKEMRGTLVVK